MHDQNTLPALADVTGEKNVRLARLAQATARVEEALSTVETALEDLSLWALEKMTEPKDLIDPEALSAAQAAQAEAEARLQRYVAAETARIAILEDKIAAQTQRLGSFGEELQGLRASNDDLRALTEAMRGALEAQLDTPQLVNRALEVELAALQATRAADLADVTAAIAELKPLLEERL